jgi:hypothetical protein
MSWMTPRERNFSLDGPFLAKRAGGAGNIMLKDGEVYTAEELAEAGLNSRNIQMMYQAHWFDMAAVEGEEAEAGGAKPKKGKNRSTGRKTAPKGKEQPNAAAKADEGEAGAATAQGEAATAPAAIVAYRHFGFGAYFAINAAGEKQGAKLSKSTAEGLAAGASVPLLGQSDPAPGQE